MTPQEALAAARERTARKQAQTVCHACQQPCTGCFISLGHPLCEACWIARLKSQTLLAQGSGLTR